MLSAQKRSSMCGPNEREIGPSIGKHIGTFCCSNWSRHCINIPQAEYSFSLHCQIEPSIIIVYPWVRTSPGRWLFFHDGLLIATFIIWIYADAPPGLVLDAVQHCVCRALLFPVPSLHLHMKSGSLQALKSTQKCSLLCFRSKLPVISLPLKIFSSS